MSNELAEWRDKHLNSISCSFCAAKWYNATIWLGSGMTTSCHHPLPHKIDVFIQILRGLSNFPDSTLKGAFLL